MSAKASLQTYRKRRDFRRTREPEGGKRSRSGRRYLIQKHAARTTHYDLRLEHDGVLKSWAVTKGPSLDPADKRLAVRTEDHPMDYGDFEGVIPAGEYGAGTVMLWDEGEWEPLDDPEEALDRGKLKFKLHGARLTGGWTLVRMRHRKGDRQDNWLLIKERDPDASEDGDALLHEDVTSVRSGRIMRAITEEEASKENQDPIGKGTSGSSGSTREGTGNEARKAGGASAGGRLPGFVAPQLATLVDEAPAGERWLHEIKYDGYRVLAAVAGETVAIRTRNGLDWTDRFPGIADAVRALACQSAQIDGEMAVADKDGRTDFGALQIALSTGKGDVGYYVFDLLSLDGRDLRREPLFERKVRLQALVDEQSSDILRYSNHMVGHGADIFEKACALGLEGIIAKRADSPYRSGRTKTWLKIKCGMGQEFVVLGWTPSSVRGRAFASLLLGYYKAGKLRYAGRVGSGFSQQDLAALSAKLGSLARKTPAAGDVPRDIARTAHFVTPKLVVETALRGWTRDGYIRQGSYKGLRGDKPAREVTPEERGRAPASGRGS